MHNWTKRTLGEIGEFVGGGTPSTSNHKYWNGSIQWYTPKEIKQGLLEPSIRTISKEGLKKSSAKLLPKGTILITTRATIGEVAIANKECATNQGFQSLIVKETEVNVFWYYWILMNKHELLRRSSGSTFKEIGKKEIQKILTLSPTKNEQQKIAAILTTWDNAIASTQSIIDNLTRRNKGLAQQLLTGKKRLKGFQEQWENLELAKLITESKIPSTNPKSSKRITVKLNLNGVTKRQERDKEVKNSTAYFIRKAGQFIYGKQNLHKGALGLIPESLDCFESTQDIPAFDFSEIVFPNWFIHFISQKTFYTRLENIANGTGAKRVHPKNLFKELIPLPPLEEQKAIAKVLLDAEQEVKLYKKKLDKLQEQKKGLMQKLLTGSIRVKV